MMLRSYSRGMSPIFRTCLEIIAPLIILLGFPVSKAFPVHRINNTKQKEHNDGILFFFSFFI